MLDFAKAFDFVPHRRLVQKIKAYRVTDGMSNWLEDFLACRRQRVTIGEASSKWSDVLSGVPQGSVLGPLLFVIYINDLPDKIENVTKLFADDSKIISVIKGKLEVEKLQKDLDEVDYWCQTWGMKLNVEKMQGNAFWEIKSEDKLLHD